MNNDAVSSFTYYVIGDSCGPINLYCSDFIHSSIRDEWGWTADISKATKFETIDEANRMITEILLSKKESVDLFFVTVRYDVAKLERK